MKTIEGKAWQARRDWASKPPESLVAGDGPFALALAFVVGAASLPIDEVKAGPQPTTEGGYPRVLEKLKRVLFVVPESMPTAEAMQCQCGGVELG